MKHSAVTKCSTVAAILMLGLSHNVRAADVVAMPVMTLEAAKSLAAAAVAEARRLNAPGGAIAVVDAGGNLVYVERLDNTFAAAARISEGKARTAALFKKPTRVFEALINEKRTAMTALTDFTPLQGGVPVEVRGVVIGGIGVSGAASAQQDDDLAEVGAKAAAQLQLAQR